jgi:lipopolysaccharide transport system ATP-binding protein
VATPAIRLEHVSKRYRLGTIHATNRLSETVQHALAAPLRSLRSHRPPSQLTTSRPHGGELWALRDVSLEIERGEIVGLIGPNGAGKSTLFKLISEISPPTEGRITFWGRAATLLEVGTGFHPELTGRENVYLNGAILGMKRREIRAKLGEIAEFSGVEKFLDTPVKRYSSGMHVRLAFSVAAHLEPEILLVDEVLSVGDAEFQARCLGRMEDIGATGRTVLFVSHNMEAVSRLCDRAILLDQGRIVRDGRSEDVVAEYLQATAGTGASRSWEDLEAAPGDDLVRLRSVRVIRSDGETADFIDVREPVGIEVRFDVLRLGLPVFPKIKLTAGHQVAFNAMDVDPRWNEPTPPGEYVATAWIPGNLLNEGLVYVYADICSIEAPKLHHHLTEYESLSFHVQDPGEGGSSRGRFTGQWKGVVRPLLDWTVEEV